MQNQSDNKFDRFIRSEVDDLKIEASFEEQWDKMSSALQRRDFTRFSVYRFNIYYLSVIVISILTLLGFWIFAANNERAKEPVGKDIKIKSDEGKFNTDTLHKEKSIQKGDALDLSVPKNLHRKKNSSDILEVNTEENPKDQTAIKLLSDTLKIPVQVMDNDPVLIKDKPDSLTRTKSVIPRRIKYVTKRDTIINIDTTKVRRKR
jgi:hypothetical protein